MFSFFVSAFLLGLSMRKFDALVLTPRLPKEWVVEWNVTFSLGGRVRLARRPSHRLLHVGHHPSSRASSCCNLRLCSYRLRLHPHGFWLHPDRDDCFLGALLLHEQPERRYFRAGSTLFWGRLMSYHAEVRAFRHGDGHWANWWRVGFHWEEGRLEKQGRGWNMKTLWSRRTLTYPKTTTNTYSISVYLYTVDALVTVAACGSSPHAQCMAGFWLSVSDGFVISSESLLGDVGREFPGLREEQKINNN